MSKPIEIGNCVECGVEAAIRCDKCQDFTCWPHQHNYGSHHPAQFAIGDIVDWGGNGAFRITNAYADHRRWKYDGYILSAHGSDMFAVNVFEELLRRVAA